MALPYSVPTVNASGTIISVDQHSAPTSSYPYDSIGPVEFRQLNFTRTCEKDYYYSQIFPNGAVPILVSEVEQCYDPTTAYWNIFITGFVILACIATVAWYIQKRSKSIVEGFGSG